MELAKASNQHAEIFWQFANGLITSEQRDRLTAASLAGKDLVLNQIQIPGIDVASLTKAVE